jgi:hypothetical protein
MTTTTDTTMTPTIPMPPMYLCDAIALVHREYVAYEEMLYSYRSASRADLEYESYRKRHNLDKRISDARALVAKAQELAQRNGWDWQAVESMVRDASGLNEHWRTQVEQHRYEHIPAGLRSR